MSDHSASSKAGGSGTLHAVLAEFKTPGELVEAAKAVRKAGYSKFDCHSPFPVHGIDPAMGIRPTVLPLVVFVGGLTGTICALLLQWWCNAHNFPWIVSGKPFFSIPTDIPIMFELTVLFGALTTFFTMWAFNNLPQVWNPLFRSDRFLKVTDNAFFVSIEAADPRFDRESAHALLKHAGAVAVEDIHYDPEPAEKKMPAALIGFIVMTAALAVVPFACVAKARASHSRVGHWYVIPDMNNQPKFMTQNASNLFPDGRASHAPPPGTVARGFLHADDFFYHGIDHGKWATTFPPQVERSMKTMKRGQERFRIYCSPCHGLSGHGDGIIAHRATEIGSPKWVPPSNLMQDYVVREPDGQIFNTISNGIRHMPAYGPQIPESDRWAIIMYLRALQRSQNASINDVPADKRHMIQ